MKTNFFLIISILFVVNLEAQTKFSIGASGGSVIVGDVSGTNYKFDLSYLANEKIEYQASFMNSQIEENNLDFKMYSINLGVGLNVFQSKKTELQPIFGFSFISFNEDLGLNDDNGLGIYFGANVIFDIGKRFNYGFNTQVTYAEHSPGGILQNNIFLRYRF